MGRDPLGQFDRTHPTDILRVQGVDHLPKPAVREPTELHERIAEAADDGVPWHRGVEPVSEPEPSPYDPPAVALGSHHPVGSRHRPR